MRHALKRLPLTERKTNSTLAMTIATTAGSGYFPVAPGTVGSLIALVALWLLAELSWPILAASTVVCFFIGVWSATECEKLWNRHDPGQVNWDEVVGMMIALIGLPHHWIVYLFAFFLFRFFDIIKPQPANMSQKLPKGWGVMSDDVIAGIYTNVLLQLLLFLFLKRILHI
jgi:phosphatidylglycerophosphatase A